MPFPLLHPWPQRLALASAILLAAGCVTSEGLEPNAQLQPAGALQAGRSLDGVALSPAAWPRQDWWTGLGDRQLDQLIGEALQGTPDLQIAEARARQAAATAQAQDAARQPTLDAKASYSGIRAPSSVAPAPLGGRYSAIKYLSLGFNYDFDLWGGERAAWEAALGQANAARIDSQAARIGLSASIARAYSDLAHAFTVRDLAEEELKRSQRMTELSQKRMSAGLDSKVQLQQTQIQLATARQQLSAAEQDIASARIALAVLLGKGPDRGLELQRPQPLNPASLSLPSVLPAELLGRRADIVAARWRVEAARRNIDSAKTEFYPNLNLGAMAGLAALHTSDVLQAPSRFFQVAPAISLPIFDGGRRRANLAERDADYDLAVGQYNKTLVQALGEVSDDLGKLRSLEQQVIDQRQARDIARSNFDLAMRRYGEGVGSYLDALSVQQQLLVAERQLASLESQQIDLSVQLVQALGGGFQPDSRSAALATAKAPAE
ncbi:TPA: efflux transporter outer membrane subunit [Pseudomonas aeruginosa]|uniref:efflux transporter outer membrane subunit n=1 Tax=Pseudomonas aeruginosa TaxID=287 RepID=UPI0005CCDBD8|nr:efflux transporter outer membrane subunit [Pseudomonas aeruginosa]EKY0766836.1 efflux transporter outer membrane subunit [Pseudomonas aeruginosa]EMC3962812.1 efflux transporter outer membrane subunit [Pseudomonas aeruginosa]KJC17427.1 multidrug RND transporter [Pseudomonas aeruginosa]KRV02960.1 multidrug RND transporter [Pseudomonas aeruginosa]MBH4504305.1 efflux transporter outer membrane subunit [Pseudomonas aeruginosa]